MAKELERAKQMPTESDVHRKSADIAFSMLKRDYVDSTDGPVEMCPECGDPVGDGSCSDCLDQQRHEGRYVELWGADQHEIGPIECQYRSVPEDHPEGEYTWDCPYCKTENQEWSGAQSVMSPFRFSSEADVQCVGCGEEVPIAEPKTFGKKSWEHLTPEEDSGWHDDPYQCRGCGYQQTPDEWEEKRCKECGTRNTIHPSMR